MTERNKKGKTNDNLPKGVITFLIQLFFLEFNRLTLLLYHPKVMRCKSYSKDQKVVPGGSARGLSAFSDSRFLLYNK